MKTIALTCCMLLGAAGLRAQPDSITLAWCYEQAEVNYPLVKQRELIASAEAYTVENARKGYLPQLNVYGQATYQSDVTSLPIQLPGQEVSPISRDQYKLYGEITQMIYDGGAIKAQTKLAQASSAKEFADLRTALYQLRARINQLYFGILLIDNRLQVLDLRKRDLQAGLDLTLGALAHGTALRSQADVFRAELLGLEQSAMEQTTLRNAYLQMLEQYVGQALPSSLSLLTPSVATYIPEQITRSELDVFDAQKKVLDLQSQSLTVKSRPKFSLFAQGGYGRPALNFLNNNFQLYGIGGVRMVWPIALGYTIKGERNLIQNHMATLEVQRTLFLFNTKLTLYREMAEERKWQHLLASDAEIIALRNGIKEISAHQLKEGVRLPADYIRDLHAEGVARENLSFHQIQYLLTGYNLKASLGQ